MPSLLIMLSQCSGLVDTKDVSDWENGFLKSVIEHCESGDTTTLSSKQVVTLEGIWRKHFAS